jgi:hypothetical protein
MKLSQVRTFERKKDARKIADKIIGWEVWIIKHFNNFSIRCDGNCYLREDGFIY